MANLSYAISQAEMSKWGERLAADNWAGVTWKYFLGDTSLLLLWLVFLCALISMLIPANQRRLAIATGSPVAGSTIFSGFLCTWLVADLTHGAIFGSGPYGYWLQTWLGANTFAEVADWTSRYMTLLGFLFS